MNVLILYFSATGNTAKMAKVIEERFAEVGGKVTMANMTSYKNRQEKIDLTPYEAVVFGAPIHSRRAPRVVREWLRTLNGQGKKCSMFFTYGGFGVHPTHYSTRQILEEQHFRVVSSAEFLGAHTFNLGGWKAMEGRPDERDFDVAKEYVERTYTRFIDEDENLLGELEKTEHPEELLDSIEALRFKVLTRLPTRGGQECGMCLVCEELCPTGAIKAESGEADKGRCIACLACVANCPEHVFKINDMSKSWPFKLKKENATDHQAFLDACREVMPSDELKLFPENEHLPEILQEWLRKRDELNLLSMRYSSTADHTDLWLRFGGGHFQCGLLAVAERVKQKAAAQYNYKIKLLAGLFYFADDMNASTLRKLKPAHLPKPTCWSQL